MRIVFLVPALTFLLGLSTLSADDLARGSSPPIYTVIGLDGEPVSECSVELRMCEASDASTTLDSALATSPPVHSLVTNERGVIELPDLSPGYWCARAVRPGELGRDEFYVPDSHSLTPDQRRRWRDRDRGRLLGLEKARRVKVSVRDAKGNALSGVIVLLADPDSADPPPSHFEETNLDQVVHGISDAAGVVEFALDPTALDPTGLGRAKRLQCFGLRYGATLVSSAIVRVAESEGKLSLTMPQTVGVRLKVGEGARGRGGRVLWAAGESFPVGARSHVSWKRGVTFLHVLDQIVDRFTVHVPPPGRMVRAFAPGATITFVVRTPGQADTPTTVTLSPEVEQSLVLSTGPRKAELHLRLIDENGDPRSARDLRFELVREGEPPMRLYARIEPSPAGPTLVVPLDPGVAGTFEILNAN